MNIYESAIPFEQEAGKFELLNFKYETYKDLLNGVRAFTRLHDARRVPLDGREKTQGLMRSIVFLILKVKRRMKKFE